MLYFFFNQRLSIDSVKKLPAIGMLSLQTNLPVRQHGLFLSSSLDISVIIYRDLILYNRFKAVV